MDQDTDKTMGAHATQPLPGVTAAVPDTGAVVPDKPIAASPPPLAPPAVSVPVPSAETATVPAAAPLMPANPGSLVSNVAPAPVAAADQVIDPAPSAAPPAIGWLPPTVPLQPPTTAGDAMPAVSQTSAPAVNLPTPEIADDGDLIEKEWVLKAKEIVDRTRQDPYVQTKEINKFKAEYMKKRYNKTIELVDD